MKDWKKDPITEDQIRKIKQLSLELSKSVPKIPKLKGDGANLIIKLKKEIEENKNNINKFFNW